jgi:hypothetical protein
MGHTARDNYRRKTGRKTIGPAFVQLYYYLLDSEAWHQLTFTARAAYIEMARLYNGVNNGTLAMGARRLAKQLPCTPNTAARVLHELDDAGFIEPTKFGSFGRKGKERRATEYRLTCYRCDVTGEIASKRFNPKKRHAATYRNLRQHASVFDTEGLQDEQTVSKTNTFEANFGPANVPNIDTHIDIYHAGSGEGEADLSSLPSSSLPSLVGQKNRARHRSIRHGRWNPLAAHGRSVIGLPAPARVIWGRRSWIRHARLAAPLQGMFSTLFMRRTRRESHSTLNWHRSSAERRRGYATAADQMGHGALGSAFPA